MEKFEFTKIADQSKSLGGLVAGAVVGNIALKQDKENGYIFPTVLMLGGLVGATMIDNDLAKSALMGASMIGTIKLVNKVTEPTVAGINGVLPETMKESIRKFFPTLGNVDDIQGRVTLPALPEPKVDFEAEAEYARMQNQQMNPPKDINLTGVDPNVEILANSIA